jgi:cyclopropane-fatty-acyl-phospholipid synthase
MTIAETVAPLVCAAVGPDVPVKIRRWDGSRSGPASAQ